MAVNEPSDKEQRSKSASAEGEKGSPIAAFSQDLQRVPGHRHYKHEQHAAGDPVDPRVPDNPADDVPHGSALPRSEAATLPEPTAVRNHEEFATMDDQSALIARAEGMLAYLRTLDPIVAHEEAVAAIAASITYLRERFGDLHAVQTVDGITTNITEASMLIRAEASPAGLH